VPGEKPVPGNLAPDYQAALDEIERAGRTSADPLKLSLAAAREKQHAYFAYLSRDLPKVDATLDLTLDGPHGKLPVRVHWPTSARGQAYTVFVRGAGWWAGNLDTHDRSARQFANLTGFPVCSIDYHCAPEAHFPVQVDETVFAVEWVAVHASELGLGGDFILQGESAGANLSAVATSRLVERGKTAPRGLVLFYGNFAGPTEKSRPYSRWVWSQYLGSETLTPDPNAVPLNADVKGFPPTWLSVGEEDPLVTDTMQMAEKLAGAGVPCTVRQYPGLPHAYVMLSGMSATAQAAVLDSTRCAAEMLGAPR